VAKRRETQPVAASAGCIFKNPESIPAGRLVEELGFKDFSVGGARVSEVHGNFIVNDGGATASDVLTLIDEIRAAADRTRGIQLETEVQIVGVPA
jgi:UDP-N-acetylenolpyruvoylglucosamine reductase